MSFYYLGKSKYLLMSLAMLTWAAAWTSAKISNQYMSYENLTFLRFFIGSLSLVPLVYKKGLKPYFIKKNLLYILPTSILFFFYNICFFIATDIGEAGRGSVLVTTINPVFTVLLMSLITKKFTLPEVTGVCLGIIGGLLIMNIFQAGMINIFSLNNIYFLFCGIIWGIMTVLMNYGQKNMDSFQFIFICYLFTSIISLIIFDFGALYKIQLDNIFFLNFFIVSIGAMSFGTSVYIYLTPVLGPKKVSVFIFSVPLISMSIAYLFLSEPIKVETLIGGMISILGIYIVNKK